MTTTRGELYQFTKKNLFSRPKVGPVFESLAFGGLANVRFGVD